MKKFIDLSNDDLLLVNGGESLAYRAGQVIATIWDITFGGLPGVIDTAGGLSAFASWFGK